MDTPPPDRRPLILGGAIAALLIGVTLAMALRGGHRPPQPQPPPTGLVVKSADSARLDPGKTLHCFVDGQLAGELTLSECAQRNGVAAGALDVGIDANGQLGAAADAGTAIAPLPPDSGQPVLTPAPALSPAPSSGASTPPQASAAPPAPSAALAPAPRVTVAACWRYDNNSWTRLPGEQSLNACVQTLYAGRCERAGAAAYGRWGEQTLRLIPRRVEISSDNRSFHTLVEQAADCSLAATP